MQKLQNGHKRRQLENLLKDLIIEGRWKPGEPFPTYDELDKLFNASRATLSHVLQSLKRDLYTVAVERRGTFVADRIPARHRIGMVFRLDEFENSFWSKIAAAAQRYNQRPDAEYEFALIREHILSTPHSKEYAGLHDQLKRRMLGAMFFPFPPNDNLFDEFFSEFPDVPRVSFSSLGSKHTQLLIGLDAEGAVNRVVDYFARQEVRRVALIASEVAPQISFFTPAVADAGLMTRPEWMVPVAKENPQYIKNIVRLLLSLPAGQRPEGFYVANDIDLEAVQTAIIESGLSPESLCLVSHANFPDKAVPLYPVKRVGFSADQIVSAIAKCVDEFYENRSEEKIMVPAEEEPDPVCNNSTIMIKEKV